MVLASGIFYYFKMDEVIDLLNSLNKLGDVEVVFDCVSSIGMKFTRKYMKDIDKVDAKMYFYIDNPNNLINKIENATLIDTTTFYEGVNKSKMKLITRISMTISDVFSMVKLIHLKIKNK